MSRKKKRQIGEGTSICINCANSTGLCSWSSQLIPVPGWSAVKHKIHDSSYYGFRVDKCPLFTREKREKHIKEWSAQEVEFLKDAVGRLSAKRIASILGRNVSSVNYKINVIKREQKGVHNESTDR